MQSLNTYKPITTAATTTFYGTETRRVILAAIFINRTTVGTVTIKAGTTTIGIIEAGALKGTYWLTDNGTEIESLTIVTNQDENITVAYRNI